MPKPQATSKRPPRKIPATTRPSGHSPQAPLRFETVDPAWILKALAAMLAVALVCGYLTICLIFSHSQWQIVLHPSRTVSATPTSLGLSFTEVHFADDASGQPQIDGWWIPAGAPTANSPAQPQNNPTALILHGGSGSMANALPQAQLLHNERLNVLLFDYRGFGHSAGLHPTQSLMQADADSAYSYLTATRNLAPTSVIVLGEGLGAPLAVQLCAQHPQIPALILEAPDGDLGPRVRADTRSHLIPVRLLFREDFPLAAPLRTLRTPKLLISFTRGTAPAALEHAAHPKIVVQTKPNDHPAIQQALSRFLGSYLPRPPT